MKNNKNNNYLVLITIVASLAGLLFGYDTGVIGGSQLYFTEHFGFNETQQGWAVSSALIGCLAGSLLAGLFAAYFGRKVTLILSAVLFIISAYGSGIPDCLAELMVYRIIGGFGVGVASMVAPMYIAELAPAEERGRLVSYYQLAVVIGFFVVFLATYFIGGGDTSDLSDEQIKKLHDYNVHQGWRVMFWSELFPASVFLLFLFFVPRSPRWLVMKGKDGEALDTLIKINGYERAQEVIKEIETSIQEDKQHSTTSIFGHGLGLVLFIGIMLSVFQQVTGINAILYYGAEIFSNALGYGPEDALKQQILLGAVNLVFTFVAIFTVDKWGRKPLLITGTFGMAFGILLLGTLIYTNNLGIFALLGLLIFIASFAMSMGPIVWVMLSEIFPNRVRSVYMSLAVGVQWFANWLVSFLFPIIVKSELNATTFNGALPYFIFGTLCIATILFVFRFIPETKGKTLEEMEAVFKRK